MESFFDTVVHRWPAGRADYHWHILPPADVTRGLVGQYRELTGRDSLAAVAPEWIHVTLLHSGPVAQLTEAELAQIANRAQARCGQIPAFELTLDRPNPGQVAVECPGRPGAPALRLWRLLADIIQEVTGGRFPLVPEVYYPHASLAYGVATVDHRPMKVWLSDCPAGPVTFPVTRIALVAQSHDLRHITWRPVADLTLAPP